MGKILIDWQARSARREEGWVEEPEPGSFCAGVRRQQCGAPALLHRGRGNRGAGTGDRAFA